jgi:hypothetical protein
MERENVCAQGDRESRGKNIFNHDCEIAFVQRWNAAIRDSVTEKTLWSAGIWRA